jgi:hypothetical protein
MSFTSAQGQPLFGKQDLIQICEPVGAWNANPCDLGRAKGYGFKLSGSWARVILFGFRWCEPWLCAQCDAVDVSGVMAGLIGDGAGLNGHLDFPL